MDVEPPAEATEAATEAKAMPKKIDASENRAVKSQLPPIVGLRDLVHVELREDCLPLWLCAS